jgi:hypothetical protein
MSPASIPPHMQRKRLAIALAFLAVVAPVWGAGKYSRNPKLVGKWSYKGAEGGSVVTISADGTWSAIVSYPAGQPDDQFSGKWITDDDFIYWAYETSSSPKVKVGARDRDRLIEIGTGHFEVETTTRRRHTYFRVKN